MHEQEIGFFKIAAGTWRLALLLVASTHAATWFVAPAGDDAGPGSQIRPFATPQRAHDASSAGDTVWFRAGVYRLAGARNAGFNASRSGTVDKPIRFWAYPGERPDFDCSGLDIQDRIKGINVTGSHLHFRGFALHHVPQRITRAHESWGIWVSGSGNVFEALDLHHNQGPGLFIAEGGGNLVLNCDSHHNYDPLSSNGAGENADGFGCHSDKPGNAFRGCRSWWNSDDGYDCINAESPVLFERSWSWLNGYLPGSTTSGRNGAGFKVGKSQTGVRHVVRFCVAFQNKAQGFYANHSLGGNDWISNTAFGNKGPGFDMLSDTLLVGDKVHRLRNNVAVGGTAIGDAGASDMRGNSWNLTSAPVAGDFQSVDTAGVSGPRRADGSVPALAFLTPKAGGALVDCGVESGFPFVGQAPDLGAFEWGAGPDAIRGVGRMRARTGIVRADLRDALGRWFSRTGARP